MDYLAAEKASIVHFGNHHFLEPGGLRDLWIMRMYRDWINPIQTAHCSSRVLHSRPLGLTLGRREPTIWGFFPRKMKHDGTGPCFV